MLECLSPSNEDYQLAQGEFPRLLQCPLHHEFLLCW